VVSSALCPESIVVGATEITEAASGAFTVTKLVELFVAVGAVAESVTPMQ
jgi:hypothetical protein